MKEVTGESVCTGFSYPDRHSYHCYIHGAYPEGKEGEIRGCQRWHNTAEPAGPKPTIDNEAVRTDPLLPLPLSS